MLAKPVSRHASRITVAVVAAFAIACSNQTTTGPPPISSTILHGTVNDGGTLVPHVRVLVLVRSGNDVQSQTDGRGAFSVAVPKEESVTGVVAASLGRSGFMELSAPIPKTIDVQLSEVPKAKAQAVVASDLWFGVFDEIHGDARFRYQGTFKQFYCVNYLPTILGQTGDVNRWDSWDLKEFLPTYKGKLLLVSTRHRWYHAAVYGYSIRYALVLIASR